MSPKRAPSSPPQLEGFEYESLLGSGGFADVFLYQQHLPKRQVAVKVMLADKVDDQRVQDFTAEANVMAQLSSHPAIVNIYQAGVSDDGRPYLVMENCPRPNLQVRHRKAPFSVAEALSVGVQVAGAVETAHRAGILHRDIKPANVLVTAYNRPALTDFGIAGTVGAQTTATGMSIPWSPPESFAERPTSSVHTDIYALGATVYTLLAGHSPFELPGQRNTAALMIERVQSTPMPPLTRQDIPTSLQSLLAQSMAKNPGDRFASALEFSRALQKVQIELSMSVTPVDVLDDSVDEAEPEEDDDGRTRVRSVVSIDPQQRETPPAPSARPADDDLDEADTRTVMRGGGRAAPVSFAVPGDSAAAPSDTVVRQPVPEASPAAAPEHSRDAAPPAGSRRTPFIVGGVAAVVVAALVGAGMWATGGDQTPQAEETVVKPVDDVAPPAPPPTPSDLTVAVADGQAEIAWSNPKPEDGDQYLWSVVTDGVIGDTTATEDTEASFDWTSDEPACVLVLIRRANGQVSDTPAEGCSS